MYCVERDRRGIIGDVETSKRITGCRSVSSGNLCCQAHLLPHTLPRDAVSESKHVPPYALSSDNNLLSPYII